MALQPKRTAAATDFLNNRTGSRAEQEKMSLYPNPAKDQITVTNATGAVVECRVVGVLLLVLYRGAAGNVIIWIGSSVDADPSGDGESFCIVGVHKATGDAGR